MKLKQESEFHKMEASESDAQLNKAIKIIENVMRLYDEKFMGIHNVDEKIKLFNKWKALNDAKEKIEQFGK